jgi:DHA2 family multidrug resistance protein
MVQALLARREQFHQARMVSNLQPLNPIYEHAIRTLSHAFATRGAAPSAALHMATGEIYALMQRQALMMSFEDVFRALMLFVLVISPIVLLLKRGPAARRSGAEAIGEAIG